MVSSRLLGGQRAHKTMEKPPPDILPTRRLPEQIRLSVILDHAELKQCLGPSNAYGDNGREIYKLLSSEYYFESDGEGE